MKWSWKIARIAGIDVYIHATFLILIAWLGMNYWLAEGSLAAVLNGVGFILALFACVVLHEFGHALTARRFGIVTRHITLLPIGGIASMERMPRKPVHELLVALAGPAVNLVIALVLWAWLRASGALVPVEELGVTGGPFLQRLMIINIILAVFNLLPAFPMDGGRVLRAALAMRMDYAAATSIAASIGQALALGLGLLGLFTNPFLVFIALFVWIGAVAESGDVQIKSALSGISVGRAMLTRFDVLSPDDLLAHAIDLTLAGTQKDFPVLENAKLVGVLTQSDLLRGLRERGDQARVGELMQQAIEMVDINESLEVVLDRLRTCKCRLVPVIDSGKLTGIVNLDNITELLQIKAALQEKII